MKKEITRLVDYRIFRPVVERNLARPCSSSPRCLYRLTIAISMSSASAIAITGKMRTFKNNSLYLFVDCINAFLFELLLFENREVRIVLVYDGRTLKGL